MDFDPLVVLRSSEGVLWVAGPLHETRDDGSSSLMVAVAYGAGVDFPEGSVLTDELGGRWCLTHSVEEGFRFDAIVLEEEEFYVRSAE